MKKLAIFIPAYNEERAIGSVVLQSKKYGEVFVVDDGSLDRTAQIAAAAGARVIRRRENGGYGAALKTIFETAAKADCDAFITIDGDGQHDPEEIPRVAAPVLRGKADVCVGSRFLGRFVGAPAARVGAVKLLNEMAGLESEHKPIDFQCGFRAFSKKAALRARLSQKGYAACGEAIASCLEAGLKVVEVPVSVRYFGENGGAFAQGMDVLGFLANSIAKKKPLVFFAGGGLALVLVSALFGLFVVDTFYSKRVLPIGSAFLTVFTGIVGLVLISIGINLYALDAILEKKGAGRS